MATSSPSSSASRRLPRIGVPDSVRDAATTFWMQREPRERRILAGGGAILVLVILYLLLWEPAFEGQRRIEKARPGSPRAVGHCRRAGAAWRRTAAGTQHQPHQPWPEGHADGTVG
jgi:type II secretory pathway component PulM